MPQPGNARSPFQEGFAALREEPLLLLAELTWRWCFGFAAWLLVLLATVLFLDSINASVLDRYVFGSLQPVLYSAALARLLQGTLLRVVWIKFTLLTLLSVLWALTAAAGRAASFRRLISLVGGDDRDEFFGWQFWPMVQLHLVRILWIWTAIACLAASFPLGFSMQQRHHAAFAAFFYVFGVALSIVFGVILNWFFGLAPLFCIRNQVNARDAVALTLDFCSRQAGRLFGLSLGFFALRLLWAGSMFFLVLAPTSLAKHVAIGWILLMVGVLFLIYLAGADALYLARLGAYASLADIDTERAPEPTPESTPEPQPGVSLNFDPDECNSRPAEFSPSA